MYIEEILILALSTLLIAFYGSYGTMLGLDFYRYSEGFGKYSRVLVSLAMGVLWFPIFITVAAFYREAPKDETVLDD